ncbi:MAG: cyclic nucleotide-binding domain-containing protein [Ghiorsea sp.]
MNVENTKAQLKHESFVTSIIESKPDFKAFVELDLVRNMERTEAMQLFSCMTKKIFPAEEVIYHAGSLSSSTMYIVLSGKVNVKNESGYKYCSMRQGDVFGLFSFLDDKRCHSATIQVEREVEVLTLDRSYFNLISLEEPKLGTQLMQFMFRLLSEKALEMEVEYSHVHKFAFGGKV